MQTPQPKNEIEVLVSDLRSSDGSAHKACQQLLKLGEPVVQPVRTSMSKIEHYNNPLMEYTQEIITKLGSPAIQILYSLIQDFATVQKNGSKKRRRLALW